MKELFAILVAAAFLALSGCNAQAKRAMEPVDQKLKPMGVKQTEMSLFVVDPASPERAYISLIATWNFANSAGQPQKENLGYIVKKDGEAWKIEKEGLRYTDDKSSAIAMLRGGK